MPLTIDRWVICHSHSSSDKDYHLQWNLNFFFLWGWGGSRIFLRLDSATNMIYVCILSAALPTTNVIYELLRYYIIQYEMISLWTLGMISITYPLPKQCQFILYGVIAHILLVGQLFDLHPRRLDILFEGGNIVLAQCRLVDNFLQIFHSFSLRFDFFG